MSGHHDGRKIVAHVTDKKDKHNVDQPPAEEDLGGGDICSPKLEPSTEDDKPLD